MSPDRVFVALAAVLAGLGLAGFLAMAEIQGLGESAWSPDVWVQARMAELVRDPWTPWVRRFTALGGYVGCAVIASVVALLLAIRRHHRAAITLFFVSGGAGLLVSPLKAIFERPRPAASLAQGLGWSFPSGHAFASLALWGCLAAIAFRNLRPGRRRIVVCTLCWTVPLLMGISRLYLDVHWLSDVLGGWFAGLLWLEHGGSWHNRGS